jgi:dolichol-phosphate mannosyltransferase
MVPVAVHQKDDLLISLVLACYNEDAVFPSLQDALVRLSDTLEREYRVEIILVDDGSRDGTWRKMQSFAEMDDRVKALSLSRNFGHQLALTCGYDWARGDAVVSMDADLQDPPEVVLEMVAKWREGFDVVIAVRKQRETDTLFKRWTATAFYRLIRWMGALQVREEAADFRLMNRQSLDALLQMRETHRFIRGMVGWVGFRTTEVYFEREPRRAGETKYPLRKMLRFATDGIISFSSFPLRVAYWMALVLMLLSFGYLGYNLMLHFVWKGHLVPGWASLLVVIIAFGTMNLICLGLMGEYIGRLYEQVKQRPLYVVRRVIGSRIEPVEKRS